jgi:hypothetical protein
MAIPTALGQHVGATNCFNPPAAIGMATAVTAGDTSANTEASFEITGTVTTSDTPCDPAQSSPL